MKAIKQWIYNRRLYGPSFQCYKFFGAFIVFTYDDNRHVRRYWDLAIGGNFFVLIHNVIGTYSIWIWLLLITIDNGIAFAWNPD